MATSILSSVGLASAQKSLNVAVIGAGVIGASWTTLFLAKGHKVTVTDPAPNAEQGLRKSIEQVWYQMKQMGAKDDEYPKQNLKFTADLKTAVEGAEFVQENGPENLQFKIKLFRDIDAYSPKHAIIASSSSGLPSSRFVGECINPERILIGHPFNPPHLVPLVELVPNSKTSQDTINQATSFYRSMGKTPVLLRKEVPGFCANRLQAALMRECYSLVKEGICSADDVNAAVSQGPGLRWALLGPFLDNYLGGGSGGIRHMLEHLGPAMEMWWADFKPVTLDKDTREEIIKSVEEVVAHKDMELAVKDRDDMLMNIISEKREKSSFYG